MRHRSSRDNMMRVDLPYFPRVSDLREKYHKEQNTHKSMRPIIMRLNMLKVARILECGVLPVELPHPAVDVRVSVADGADVALEVHDVDGVEANLDEREEHEANA